MISKSSPKLLIYQTTGNRQARLRQDTPRLFCHFKSFLKSTPLNYINSIYIFVDPNLHMTLSDRNRNRNTLTKGRCAVINCPVTRAVHMTCLQDLSKPSFQQALDRLVGIRGATSLLISDNATCFSGATNSVNELTLKLRTLSEIQRSMEMWTPVDPIIKTAVKPMNQKK